MHLRLVFATSSDGLPSRISESIAVKGLDFQTWRVLCGFFGSGIRQFGPSSSKPPENIRGCHTAVGG